MSQIERELGWEDTIERDGGDFIILPEGDYDFTVAKFERSRFSGSAKLPPCNQAKLELIIHSPEHGDVTIGHSLFLHTKTEGILSNFFAGIGQKKKGEPLRMNWNAVIGAKGRLKLYVDKFTGNDGKERESNKVRTFYDYFEVFGQGQHQPQQQTYQQPQQQQQQYQAPFPQQGQQQGGGFTPGQF